MRDVTLLNMKNKSVHSCRFVHHAKYHCLMTTLIKLFEIEFEKGGELEKSQQKLAASLYYRNIDV